MSTCQLHPSAQSGWTRPNRVSIQVLHIQFSVSGGHFNASSQGTCTRWVPLTVVSRSLSVSRAAWHDWMSRCDLMWRVAVEI